MVTTYLNYTVQPVFGEVNEELGAEIVAFWIRNNAIADGAEARRRTREVAFVMRNPGGEIAGIASVYTGNLPDGLPYYFYRMFIQPRDRIHGMMRAVTLLAIEYFERLTIPDKPRGMVIVTENVKLMRKGIRRLLSNRGFLSLGKTAHGLEVWKYEFRSDPGAQ